MNKKRVLVIFIILLVIIAIAVYFILNNINQEKRKYTIETISEYKYFVSKIEDKYGVIDSKGNTIIDASYDKVEIPNPSKDVFICYKNDKALAYNASKQQLYTEYNSVEPIKLKNNSSNVPYEKSVLKCEKNNKYGLIDFLGNNILKTEYDSIEGFANIEGELQIIKNNKMGVANIKGAILVNAEYDIVESDDYLGYIVGNQSQDEYKYGYINNEGKIILKAEYNEILRVPYKLEEKDSYLIVNHNGQYGVMKNKNNIINNEYKAIEYNEANNIFILEKDNFGIANINGDIVIPVENTSIQVKGEYIYAKKDSAEQVYDTNGNKADIDFNKSIMSTPNENYKITIDSNEYNNYYGVADKNNRQFIEPEYLYIEYAFDNYFIASNQEGKLGLLDSNGNEVIEFKYDLVKKIQGKNIIQTLLSNTNTIQLYSPKMSKMCEISNATVETEADYIKIYSNSEMHYYTNGGEEISNTKIFTNHKLFLSIENGQWGFVDISGDLKVEYQYEQATEFNDYGYAAIKKDGKWGCIDENGNIIVEPTYELDETYGTAYFIGEYIKNQNGYYTKNV